MDDRDAFLEEMTLLYERVEEAIARLGVSCRQCGRCCDFRASQVVAYASSPEIEYLVSRYPHASARRLAEGRCSLQEDGRCSVHPARPLGCRTAFCTRRRQERLQAIYETFYGEIKQLADQHSIPWSYERLLPE